MWAREDKKRLFSASYKTFDLVASTVVSVTIYNHASQSAGGARLQNDPMPVPRPAGK